MAETGPIYIKSLLVRAEGDGQARIEAKLENRSSAATLSMLLLLYFYDDRDRIRDRISINLKPFAPNEVRTVSSFFRLKSAGFFTYTARLEKTA